MLLQKLISFVAPYSCLSCGRESNLICTQCLPALAVTKRSSCFLCNKLTAEFRTCTACRRKTKLAGVIIASHYESHVKNLIRRLKYNQAQTAAPLLVQIVLPHIPMGGFDIVTGVPASTRRFRQRGYNQAALLAKAVACARNLPYIETLGRTGHSRQVGTSRLQRWQQLQGAFYVRSPRLINGTRILIVDDVVTTGATLSECAKILKKAGARSVWSAAIAKH